MSKGFGFAVIVAAILIIIAMWMRRKKRLEEGQPSNREFNVNKRVEGGLLCKSTPPPNGPICPVQKKPRLV